MANRALKGFLNLRWALVSQVLLGILVGDASAQQAPSAPARQPDLLIAPRWTKGESRVYEQLKVRRQIPRGEAATQASSRARIDINVLEAGKNGYLLSWVLSESTLEGSRPPAQEAELAGILKAMEGWNILLDLDHAGNLRGVRNWKELKTRAESLSNSILQGQKYQGLTPEVQTRLRSQLKARLESKGQIEELCTSEARIFLAPIGLNFKASQPVQYEATLPNPRGGKPFPVHAQFELTTIDPASARAIVDWKQFVDSAGGDKSQSLGDSIKQLGKNFGRPPGLEQPQQAKPPTIRYECRYLIDLRTGWVNDLKHLQVIRAQDGSATEESLRIRRIDPNARQSPGTRSKKETPKDR